MFSLQDLLGQEQGDQAINHISESTGADPSAVSSVVQSALPMLLGGLANNASTPDGAESLNNALDQNHDGSILNNIGGLESMIFGGGQQGTPSPDANAGGILSHIFGDSQGQIAQQVSNQTGVGTGQVAQILMFLAPVVMGYLGQQKQQQGVGASGLGSLIGGLLGGGQSQAAASGMMGNLAASTLDSNRDGSVVDDIASMAFKYIQGR
jgi:hypothetical protein